jgi:hypothetical protein
MVALIVLFASSFVKAQDENIRPVADAGLSRYAGPDPIVLDGIHSYDPDSSNALIYEWRQISGPSVVIIDGNTATPTIAGSIGPGTGRDTTKPKPKGFAQTDEVQECEFELVVSDGDLTSFPDTVKVIIVPYFGTNLVRQANPPFDPDKPTVVFFGGGDCVTGAVGITIEFTLDPSLLSKINAIDFRNGYGPDAKSGEAWRTYYGCGDIIIVYLSRVAPDYKMPIQVIGVSTGGQPAVDVGIRLNTTYQDARYAVNRLTLQDVDCRGYIGYLESIAIYIESAVDGEQCWVDNYVSEVGFYYPNVLNVGFDQAEHFLPRLWYNSSSASLDTNKFNNGVVAGPYWSVIGPGKNLQLASTPEVQTYKFKWYGDRYSGNMVFYNELNHPGKLPEPVTLVGPVDVGDPNGFVLTCEESENAVGYELLLGTDPYRVMDYEIISDTPVPPYDIITALPSDGIWWTIRVRDEYGSTIYADPEYLSMIAYNPEPADGSFHSEVWVVLSWSPGVRSMSCNVYFSDNFDYVNNGKDEAFMGNQITTNCTLGLEGFAYPAGLVPGITYFWRIDDVDSDETVIHKGNIWRFTVSF